MSQQREQQDHRRLSGSRFRIDPLTEAEQALRRGLYSSPGGESFFSPRYHGPVLSPAGSGGYRQPGPPGLPGHHNFPTPGLGAVTHGLPVCDLNQSRVFQPLSDIGSAHNLIRADPDEELQINTTSYRGSPESSQGLTNAELAGLRARLRALEDGAEAAEKDRLRTEQMLDKSAQAINSLVDELKELRNRPVPAIPPIVGPGPQGLQHIQAERIDASRLTPQQVTATLAYESATLALSKRPLSETSTGSALDSAKRAKTTTHEATSNDGDVGDDGHETTPTAQPSGGPGAPNPNDDQPTWDLLTFLKTMDCRSTADLLRLRDYIAGPRPFELPLLTEPTGNGRFHYILKIGGKLSTPVAADPTDCPAQPAAAAAEVAKLKVLELAVHERAFDKAAEDGAAIPVPTYLVPLGEVYAAHRGTAKAHEVCSTNFFVLLDITTPRKGVWMVYRFQRAVERAGGVKWDNVKPSEREKDLFFRFGALKKPFDTVCLLTEVAGWESPVEDMVRDGVECFGEGSVGGGRRSVKPVFMVPDLEVMRGVVERRWKDGEEGEEDVVEA